MLQTAASLKKELTQLADPKRADVSRSFFKTGKGQYAEGDVFIGVRVPDLRKVARAARGIDLKQVLELLRSSVHEERLLAVFLLVDLYRQSKKDEKARAKVVSAYLKHLRYINNWDLVDSSAPQILGNWLLTRSRDLLYEQAASKRLWTRRVAMIATQELIKNGESSDALRLAEILLTDPEDLMHKAVGWMLREVGKKVSVEDLQGFLSAHAQKMPRTMLRYAIEKLPERERRRWMAKKPGG